MNKNNPLLQLLEKYRLSDVEILAQYLENAESLQDDNNYWKSRCSELLKRMHDIDLVLLPIILDRGYPILECNTVLSIKNALESMINDCERYKSAFDSTNDRLNNANKEIKYLLEINDLLKKRFDEVQHNNILCERVESLKIKLSKIEAVKNETDISTASVQEEKGGK